MQGILIFNAFLENTSDSIVIKEYFSDGKGGFIGGNIVAASAAKARHYGLNMNTIRGHTDFDLIPFEQAKKARQDDLWVMCHRKPLEDKRETITHKNGEEVKVSVTKFPWFMPSGEIVGVMCIARNITIREKARQQTKEMLEFMEHEIMQPLISICNNFKSSKATDVLRMIIFRSMRKVRETKGTL